MSDTVAVANLLVVAVRAGGRCAVVANAGMRHVVFIYNAVSIGSTVNLVARVNIWEESQKFSNSECVNFFGVIL